MKSIHQCFDDFLYVECYLSSTLELISITLFLTCLTFVYLRGLYGFMCRKTIIFTFICVSNLFYFIYNIKRQAQSLYFLQSLSYSLFQTYLIYYFGRKATMFDSRSRLLIQFITLILCLFDVGIFIYCLVVSKSEKMCKNQGFTWMRALSFVSQIIFTIIAKNLYHKMQDVLKETLLKDNTYIDHKSKLDQLMFLVYLSLCGSALLFLTNFTYMINTVTECRIIPHIGADENYNYSDMLNSLISIILKIISFFLPCILTLILFRPHKKHQVDSQVEPEPLEKEYFDGLSLKYIEKD